MSRAVRHAAIILCLPRVNEPEVHCFAVRLSLQQGATLEARVRSGHIIARLMQPHQADQTLTPPKEGGGGGTSC